MKNPSLGFGIVGPGMIAGVVAEAIGKSSLAVLTAVSSRRLDNAARFSANYPGAAAVEGASALLGRPDVDAVYIATPTVAKEAIALAAIAAGKHVLVDKPFVDLASARRMTEAASAAGVVFMDATHFVHHPRTALIRAAVPDKIGKPQSLHTTFYFPFSDRANIRFDASQEPMTALGDMAWYAMRAVVEYLQPAGAVTRAVTVPERDPQSGAIIRASGLIAFASGEVSTFDVGYTAGTVLMDLDLLGTTGVIRMDDFVLDWANSWSFRNPENPAGYYHRTGMATRRDITFIPTPAETPQEVSMIDSFAGLAASGDSTARTAHSKATLLTQQYLDALWQAAHI
jgi:predicted dehydrogenase